MEFSRTRFLLERAEYTEYIGQGIASQQETDFRARLKQVQDISLYNALPEKLQNKLIDNEETLGDELTSFVNNYVKSFLAFELAAMYFKEGSIMQTPTGMRILTDGTSSPALSKEQSEQSAKYSSRAGVYQRKMLEEWRVKDFTFDGVKYPPECNQVAYQSQYGVWYFYDGFVGYMQTGNWQQGYPPTGGSVRMGGVTTSFI